MRCEHPNMTIQGHRILLPLLNHIVIRGRLHLRLKQIQVAG
jgi:hypothetical protein